MDPRLQLLQVADESRRQLLRVLLHRTCRLSRNPSSAEASQGGSTPRPASKVSATVPADSAAERSFPVLLIVWLGLGVALAVLFIWYFLLRTA
jgi:hypothetical protein